MSEGVLTAVIAASATVLTSFVQLRASLAKEFAARGGAAPARRKSRLPIILICAMLAGAVIGGFALAQWLHEYERIAQNALEHDLRERIAELSKMQSEFQQARTATRAEIEAEIMRRMGTEGVVVLATVTPCKPPLETGNPASLKSSDPQSSAPDSASVATPTCSESDAAPITLCATVPIAAKLTALELFVRASDETRPWDHSRALPGQEIEQARFAEQPSELADSATTRQVCEGFRHWADRPQVARMVVHYAL